MISVMEEPLKGFLHRSGLRKSDDYLEWLEREQMAITDLRNHLYARIKECNDWLDAYDKRKDAARDEREKNDLFYHRFEITAVREELSDLASRVMDTKMWLVDGGDNE